LVSQLLQTYDEILTDANQLTKVDKQNILALTYKKEWASYEKMLNNLIFRNYRQILVDEDIKSAKKLIYFLTAQKNIPKSFKNDEMETNQDEIQTQGDGDIGIEI
jgi:excinuclease UvrABC ATPase subunit